MNMNASKCVSTVAKNIHKPYKCLVKSFMDLKTPDNIYKSVEELGLTIPENIFQKLRGITDEFSLLFLQYSLWDKPTSAIMAMTTGILNEKVDNWRSEEEDDNGIMVAIVVGIATLGIAQQALEDSEFRKTIGVKKGIFSN